MADRMTFNEVSTEIAWGGSDGLGEQYARHIGTLYRAAGFALGAVSGVNDLTAALDPVLDGAGLVDGMRFSLTAPAANTGAMTLALNGGPAVPILEADGAAVLPGRVSAGLRVWLEYVGGSYRLMRSYPGSGEDAQRYWLFTASGTWVKPGGLSPDQLLLVRGWGAGGGGSSATSYGAGGGGAYSQAFLRAGDLSATIPVAIGAGGVAGNPATNGGNTTFGSLLTAFGGAGGTASRGGGGGGSAEAGQLALGGFLGGGDALDSSPTGNGGAAKSDYGGGAGSFGNSSGWRGGRAVYGAGGGGHGGGGASAYGGNGGSYDPNVQPQAPGGGGARGQSGARGQLEVFLL